MTPALAAYLRDLTTRCEQATKGPWGVCGCNRCHQTYSVPADCMVGDFWMRDDGSGAHVPLKRDGDTWVPDEDQMQANAILSAHARTDLPTLVRLVRDAHAALEHYANGGAGFDMDDRAVAHEALARAEAMVKEGMTWSA